MSRPAFSEALVAKMFAEYQAGDSLVTVATRYGRTGHCLHTVFKNRGLKMRPIPKVNDEAVAAMYADYQRGLTLSEVGEKWGHTGRAMFSIFRHRKLKLRSWKEAVGVNGATRSANLRLRLLIGGAQIATKLRRAA